MTYDGLKDMTHLEFEDFVRSVTKAVISDEDFIRKMSEGFAKSHVCAFAQEDLTLLRAHCNRWRTASKTAGLALIGAATLAAFGFIAKAIWNHIIRLTI